MKDISTADLLLVAEDLEYLGEWGSDISNREIRHGGAMLRRLIVDGVYGQAWRAVGLERRELELIAVDFDAVFPVGTQQSVQAERLSQVHLWNGGWPNHQPRRCDQVHRQR